MGTINLVNIFGLITGLAAVTYLALLIRPGIIELRRPRNGFYELRQRLVREVIIVMVLIGFRLPFFVDRIDAPYSGWWQAMVSVATSTALLYFAYNKYMSYTFKERPTPPVVPDTPFEKSPAIKKITNEADKEVKEQ